MHTFAQKPKATQETTSGKSTIPGRGHPGQSPEARSILHLPRTIGNQAVQRMLRTDAEEPEADLTGPASLRSEHDFGRIPMHAPAAGAIRTKLAINELGDSYEQDADRMAEHVMRTPEPQLQRAEQPGREHESLQTKRVQASDTGQRAAPPIVHEVLRSPGHPLDPATRAFMEPRFGHDFSGVRFHSGAIAEQSARDLNANAYTVGNDVVFGAGRFAPGTREGRRLIAHELAHVTQPNATSVLRRELVRDAGGNFVSYEFRVGHELTEAFALEAKRLTADGALGNADIEKLKAAAAKARGTVSDHERMFMGALLDAANVGTLQQTTINATASITFALATITEARLKQVIEAGRPALAASVATPAAKAWKAFGELDIAEGAKQLGKLESAAETEVRALVGAAFARRVSAVIAFGRANSVPVSNMLLAMLSAASDDTPSDRLMAAAAFAIAAAGKHPLADDIRVGKIHLDALSPASLARLPGAAGLRALYVGAAPFNPALAGLKGDTIYMPTDLDINNLTDRSTVIHELQHAQQDKAASPTQRPTFPAQQGLEEQAYRAQAKYILDQMHGQAASDQARSATQVALGAGDLVLLAALIEAKSDLTKYQPLVEQLFAAAAPPVRRNAAGVTAMLATPTATLDAVLQAAILAAYGITAASTAQHEGQAGESLIHWIHRL